VSGPEYPSRDKPTTLLYADDVRFSFPGDSSFAPGASNKADLERWLERFVGIGLQIYRSEIETRAENRIGHDGWRLS